MAHQLKLYVDSDLKEPVKRFSFPRTEIGQTSEISFYLYNSSEKWPIVEISQKNKHQELKYDDLPQVLRPEQKVKCRAVYKPRIDLDDASTFIPELVGELHIG